ncbi:hypothetical protein GOA89_32835 [Sinorhizobium meliloti]|nr:hypothetical protein [Sinorhizobium meliloti]MDW9850891.1 hypothetical protein [Sinorhizobium meliloti]MDX0147688.1 hypothetical protein [Sinorhizobium meliloti]MDX0153971.1 hypothetical protein [Sinorhizobium meliloti]MDX0172891.1 hypothetical protein [Sinorhizobium meliloti]
MNLTLAQQPVKLKTIKKQEGGMREETTSSFLMPLAPQVGEVVADWVSPLGSGAALPETSLPKL